MSGPIPVTIVTGFLGSGKTTLLASLIEGRKTRRLALLINEFGEVSVDGAIIRASAAAGEAEGGALPPIRIDEFPHGLIAYGDDDLFLPAMQAIAARRAGVDHVLIETSGLALPSAAMELLQGPLLSADFVLDATLAVVDTPLLLAGRFGGCETGAEPVSAPALAAAAVLFDQQLALADVVVLNKIDVLDDAALLRAEELVRGRAPGVRFLELAYKARLDIRLALGLRLHQAAQDLSSHLSSYSSSPHAHGMAYAPLPSSDHLNGHAHSGIGAHSHGLATHKHFHQQDPGWLSFTLRSDAMQPLPQLQQALAEAARLEPILRSKGFVRAEGSAAGRTRSVLVQGVRERVTLAPGNEAADDAADDAADATDNAGNGASQAVRPARRSELVFIGYHASRARIAGLLSTITATHWS
ncbi:GTP-binding protein [Oxalobacteraceae bacterium CAVE-383]|nr:GTP-binding protein [Oxalobacteraceae bacterium CAVE-383]